MRAAHERRATVSLLKLLHVVHPKDPREMQQKLLAELQPRRRGAAFARLMQRARDQAAARSPAT